jgi:hypothetical protein
MPSKKDEPDTNLAQSTLSQAQDITAGLLAETGQEAVTADERLDPVITDPGVITRTVEHHVQALRIPDWQYRGVKTREGWPVGKRMQQKTFLAALEAWLNGTPVEGKKPEKDGDQ